ncbi:metallophosphoesterase [Azospirillum cavernae]|uniref:Metallophosphoesterase n=1 Tax=Azospirillum cavernae TaxID=2320860 RepID=A0A418W3G3_9PROT|nr:metallophosphoesterase [Azospirillum cavernae]RJF84570.1 metallophosphoesterase [Azospirillum cavernae]
MSIIESTTYQLGAFLTMNHISWLHLSDWHQSGVNFDRKVLRDKLLADIESRSGIDPRLESIDFVVFSGDAAHNGAEAELAAIRDQLFKPLLNLLNLSPDRLFLVPGNHDLDRGAIKDFLSAELQAPLTKDADVQKWLGDAERLGHVLRPFRAYADFVTQYTGQLSPAYASVKRLTLAGRSVALLGFNSAWMCARNKVDGQVRDHGHLVVGEPQIHDALAATADSDLRIVVLHHAFEWLAEFDRARVESRLKDEADIILWGHEHRPQVRHEMGTDGQCLIVPAGAAFDGRVANNPRYTNAYNFVALDLDAGRGVVHLRRWNDSKTRWAKDTDSCEDGRFDVALPAGLTRSPTATEGTGDPGGGDTPSGDVGPARKGDGAGAQGAADARSPSREQRFQDMKEEMADILAVSPPAMSALETAIGLASAGPAGPTGAPDDRAARLRDHLLNNLPFDEAVNGLTRAYKNIQKSHRGDSSARRAIVQTSAWLLPWLHVVSDAVDCGPWENNDIGAVLPLPAGLKCFAEIVMAGIDVRKPKFHPVKDPLAWPSSSYAAESNLPEQGFCQKNLDTVRHDLMKRLGVSSEIFDKSDAEKDGSIRKRIAYFLEKQGTRIFMICNASDGHDEEFLERIATAYPGLGVIKLAGDVVRDQDRFDNIRHLLDFQDNDA